ncbi:MAG: hypothetical protein AAFR52_11475 [Pseudomonadota bacterium]
MRSLIASLVGVALLAGCQTTEEKLVEGGAQPLTADEVAALVVGNTLYTASDRWRHHSYYAPDGTAAGRTTWDGGEESASAVWEISEDGLWCRDWDNDWGGGEHGCQAVYPAGDGDYWFIYRRGSHGETKDFKVTVLEGNPEAL